MDFDIELGESKILQPPIGTLEIWMHKEVQQQIDRYAATDHKKELGGIIIGSVDETKLSTSLFITGMIMAQNTTSDRTSITFTHDTWKQLHKDKENLYPDGKIVGWFHTHPGFGVFLSNYDLFIHQNFFNLPWQVAYVVDPVHKKRGFYRWEGEKIVPSAYKMLNNTVGLTSAPSEPMEPTQLQKSPESSEKVETHTQKIWIVSLFLSVILLITTNVHRLDRDYQETLTKEFVDGDQHQVLFNVIESQNKEIEALQESKKKLEETITVYTENRLFFYTVESGDTLWTISQQFYKNPFEYQYLMRLNNLEDPDSLEIGQRLLLYHPTGE